MTRDGKSVDEMKETRHGECAGLGFELRGYVETSRKSTMSAGQDKKGTRNNPKSLSRADPQQRDDDGDRQDG